MGWFNMSCLPFPSYLSFLPFFRHSQLQETTAQGNQKVVAAIFSSSQEPNGVAKAMSLRIMKNLVRKESYLSSNTEDFAVCSLT